MTPPSLMPLAPLSVATAVRLRDAPRAGLTRGTLRASGWQQLSHGLHAVRRPDRPLADVAALTLAVLPHDSGFGHLTSAALRGWWLPLHLTPHVLMATTTSHLHVQRQGVYVRRCGDAVFEMVDGVRCTSAEATLVELARDLSFIDLVPMVDGALAAGSSVDTILSAIPRGARGATVLKRAVELADPRSESWWESILRLQHTTVGLGPVECQVILRRAGRFVARADLHLVGTDRYPECDGGDHRDPARQAKDLRRDRALHSIGAQRYGYTTAEIAHTPEVVIHDAEVARGLSHDPDRVAAWRVSAKSSSLTAYGRTRLAGRLARYRLAATRRVAPSGGA